MNQTSNIKHNTLAQPRFSVIMPLYNKAPYVRKALESVVAQTCQDFECIIVNDGSTDESLREVEDFIRCKVYGLKCKVISQENAGVAAARNRGVKESKGEYVAFLDADDWWEPTFLEEIAKLIDEYPDAGLYVTNYVYYKPGKTRVALDLQRGYMNFPVAYMQSPMMPVTSITVCMPRNVFDKMGGFPVGIKLGEDFLLWAKTALHYKVASCEKALAYYNNDLPASARATRNLHAPEHCMLFNIGSIEEEIKNMRYEIGNRRLNVDEWKALLDKLRVGGLMDYWMDERYHDAAAKELEEVDWCKQPKSQIRMYKTPIWMLKLKKNFMRVGSWFKHRILRLCKV